VAFSIESKHLGEIVVLVPDAYRDNRGFFMETYRADQFDVLNLPSQFVQDNHSLSHKGVIRGLHFQWHPPMGKLMRVTRGTAFLVAADIRKGSPTLGKWFGVEISAENMKQVWAPAGFARGFCALTDNVEVQYKCTAIYNSRAESAIRWDDPTFDIEWPEQNVRISERDRAAQTLSDWLMSPQSELLLYREQTVLSR
jgi:dTDP-4-dehydrorhamnose 3,5-epimerase